MKAAKNLIAGLMFTLNFALFACLIFLFWSRGYIEGAGFTSVDLVTIVLAAVAVLITALGIFIALLAIWGYNSLRSTAEDIARTTAENVVKSQLPALVRREVGDQLRTDGVIGGEKIPDGGHFPASTLDEDNGK
jgi:hypothetical protein